MTTADDRAPAVVDPNTASIARVYDVFLGGKDNYAVDREVAGQVIDAIPQTLRFAQEHRAWLIRVVRYLAGTAGVRQFLDCGSGLPTAENTHDVARRHHPEAVVIYVDNDPSVIAHGRALLDSDADTHFIGADLTRPRELFAEQVLTRAFDLDEPIALIQCSTIHHVTDSEEPHRIVQDYVDLLPSGSYLALTHWHDPSDGGESSRIARYISDVFRSSSMGSANFRTRAEIESFFDGLDYLEPGLTLLRDWWPAGPSMSPRDAVDEIVLAGVARKP